MQTFEKTKHINRSNLPALIKELSKLGAQPISLTIRTVKQLLKKNRVTREPNFIDSVIKTSTYQAILNFDYENSVNRQRAREDKQTDFKRQKNWFTHIKGSGRGLLANEEKNENYLQLKLEKRLNVSYWNRKSFSEEELKDLLPAKNKNNQGLDKDVVTICPALSSIQEFTCAGIRYVLKN